MFEPTVECDGCDYDYHFENERMAIQFVSRHSKYEGHEARLKQED